MAGVKARVLLQQLWGGSRNAVFLCSARWRWALTTFSRGAAPNTLNTGLGLDGEMHSTMACWPTLVVYSSRVARSFLKTHTSPVTSRFGMNGTSYTAREFLGKFHPCGSRLFKLTWADVSAASCGWKGWIQRCEAAFVSCQLPLQQLLPCRLVLREKVATGKDYYLADILHISNFFVTD